MGDEDEFVVLRELHDPVQASLVIDLLEQEGVGVSTSGLNHRAMLGMVGSFVAITLRVRRRDLARATELLDALDDSVTVGPDEDDEPEDDEDDREGEDPREPTARGARATPEPRRGLVAAGAAFILPGGAHFYARAPRRGFVIVLAYVCVVAAALVVGPSAGWAVLVALAADVLGGLEAVDRHNTGASSASLRARLGRALAWGAPAWVLLAPAAILGLVAFAPGTYVGASGRALCDERASCLGEDRADCLAALAEDVRDDDIRRERLSGCAACVGERSCDVVWEEVTCDEETSAGSIFRIEPLLRASTGCHPGLALRGMCAAECRGVLPEPGQRSRAIDLW